MALLQDKLNVGKREEKVLREMSGGNLYFWSPITIQKLQEKGLVKPGGYGMGSVITTLGKQVIAELDSKNAG